MTFPIDIVIQLQGDLAHQSGMRWVTVSATDLRALLAEYERLRALVKEFPSEWGVK